MKSYFYLSMALLMATSLYGEELPELQRLDQLYEKELNKVTHPVNEKYKKALMRLQKSYTSENLLDEAIAVRNELNALLAKDKTSSKQKKNGANEVESKKSLRKWVGDGRIITIDGESAIQIQAESKSLKIEHSYETKNFPEGFALHFTYRTSNYVGEGLKLRGFYTKQGYYHRSITLNADGKWHEYAWPYPAAQYVGAAEIKMVLETLSGKGAVYYKGFDIRDIRGQ